MTAHAVKVLRRGKFVLSTLVFVDSQVHLNLPSKTCFTCMSIFHENGVYSCQKSGQVLGYDYKEDDSMTACDQHNEKRPLYSVESDSFSDFLF